MVRTQQEILFLPKQTERIVQTSAFLDMKEKLAPIAAAAEKDDPNKPSLLRPHEQGCKVPEKLEYKAGQPVEDLCSIPPRALALDEAAAG
mgnify:CR=1